MHAGTAPAPPLAEARLGLGSYLTATPGIEGRLRAEPEDFRVIELGPGPRPDDKGRFAAARVELRNWETNRFVGQAAKRLQVPRKAVGFAGMKDKRAVTEQWFTFKCPLERVVALEGLEDVHVLEAHTTSKAHFAGAHEGNRFVIRVRDTTQAANVVPDAVEAIRRAGGVPNYFGPQRFGGSVRPVTHLVGRALVTGDLEEAVRLYVGNPMEGEREDTLHARTVYETTRDPEAALAVYPPQLDPERAILQRLVKRPGDWRNALKALPWNLLQLFVHAHQSYVFNQIITARLHAGLGLNTAHVGDRVMASSDDGTRTQVVTADNVERVQRELDLGRAVLTAALPGTSIPLAEGRPGELERSVLEDDGIALRDYRVSQLPEVASQGRRRGLLQPVADLDVQWMDGDPVFSFRLGKGAYATAVLREFMKVDLGQ